MAELRVIRASTSLLVRRAALAYQVIWVLSPPLAYGVTWRAIAALTMVVWVLLDVISPRSVIVRPNIAVLASVIFVLYTATIEALVPDMGLVSRHFQVWTMFFFLLVGESFRRGRDSDARFCFWIVLLVLPIWSLTTLIGLETLGDDVARMVTRSSDEAMELGALGIGGFSLVYSTALALPFLLYLALRPAHVIARLGGPLHRRAARLLLILNAVLGSLLILHAGYSIALLLGGVAFAFILLIRSRRTLPLAMSLCASALLVLVGSLALDPALGWLQEVSQGTEYSSKLADVRATLEDGRSVGTVDDRVERYTRSFRLFIENPVLGTLQFDDVGKHSAVLDRFAQYGFVIGALFLYLLVYVPLTALRSLGVPIGLGLAFLAVALTFPFLNNVFMAWGLVLFVFSRGALSAMGLPLAPERRPMGVERGTVNA